MHFERTHITADILNSEIKINRYKIIRTNSASNRTGGVVTYEYVSEKLSFENAKSDANNFIWWNSLDLMCSINRKVRIVAMYMSASERKTEILNYFEDWCEGSCEAGEIMICGDFNIDVSRKTTYSERLTQICSDNGLKQTVKSTTRLTNHSATIIDLCFTNMKADVNACIEDQISDHRNVEIEFRNGTAKRNNDPKLVRVWRNYSPSTWLNEIESWAINWNAIKNSSCETKTSWLINKLKNSANKFIVQKIVKNSNEFFDEELEKMRLHKNHLYKQAQHTSDQSHWDEYKRHKNEYKIIIKRKKYEYMQRQLDKVEGDSKGTWKLLNSIITDVENDDSYDVIVSNGANLIDKRDIANEFNKYFIDTIKQINEAIPAVDIVESGYRLPSNVFDLEKVNLSQVNKYLQGMKKKNSRDCFNITVNLLLDGLPLIGEILVDVINSSFETAHFPEMLRESMVVPIRKVAGTTKIEEYRPINTLPCVEKLIEKVACDQLNQYIDLAEILCDEQSGFRSSHSCESALNYIIAEWKEVQERKEVVLAVFLDFQRAFETIDRELLLKKLKMYGIGQNTVNWFRSYLSNK